METGFGLFEDLPENELHPLLIDVYEDDKDVRRQLEQSKTNVYQPVKEGTLLHRAIKSGVQYRIDALLSVYEADFEKVAQYLVSKYQWNVADKIWLRKTILVAVNEDQCRNAKELEKQQTRGEVLENAVFILLQNLVDGENVAVIHPQEDNRLEVYRLIRMLTPNGFLTWNYTGLDGRFETFVETSASCGRINVIARLFELGASMAIPGHNPLIAACRSFQVDTIRWLLTECFERFDCMLHDSDQRNALMIVMNRGNVELFELVLEKMISYRQKHFNETESEAFNKVFRYENDELASLCICTNLAKGPLRRKVEECIVRYEFDLSYQWKDVPILASLLCRKIALDYCFAGIRKNPELLGLVQYGTTTILQDFFRWSYLDFLKEMYSQNPTVKAYFENESAFHTLRQAFAKENCDKIQFILDNHEDFLKRDLEKLKEEVICWKHYPRSIYVHHGAILSDFFPEHRKAIEETSQQVVAFFWNEGKERPFFESVIDFSNDSIDIHNLQQPWNTMRGSNGETLLHFAVQKNNVELFVELLEAGCDFDVPDKEGNHPVHFVQNVDMFNVIIERHHEGKHLVHRKNSAGHTVLHKVCSLQMEQKHLIALLEKVIECGADVNQLTNDGESAAFLVSSCTILDILLKHDLKVDVINDEGNTALYRHLLYKNSCIAVALLELVHTLATFKEHVHKYLAFIVNSSRDIFTVDYQWFLEKHPDTTKLLFDSVYEHSRQEASRIFAKACASALNFIVDKFLDFDYDLDYNYKDEYGYTPIIGLLSYMKEPNIHLLKRLLEKNVDLEARNEWGRDALLTIVGRFSSAKWYGHSAESVQLLLEHGAKINTTDADGNTPLHLAIARGEWDLLEVLVRNGVDLDTKNNDGKSPLEMGSVVEQELYSFMH